MQYLFSTTLCNFLHYKENHKAMFQVDYNNNKFSNEVKTGDTILLVNSFNTKELLFKVERISPCELKLHLVEECNNKLISGVTINYRTSDGINFSDKEDAERHQKTLRFKLWYDSHYLIDVPYRDFYRWCKLNKDTLKELIDIL